MLLVLLLAAASIKRAALIAILRSLIPTDVVLFRTAKPCERAVAVTPAAAAAAAAAMDFIKQASPVIAY